MVVENEKVLRKLTQKIVVESCRSFKPANALVSPLCVEQQKTELGTLGERRTRADVRQSGISNSRVQESNFPVK